jgi:steroid delta-isomerase-like uncharacterized protein
MSNQTCTTAIHDTAKRIFLEVISHGDLELADLLIAPDFIDHWAARMGAPPGLAGFKMGLSMIRTAFPDWSSTPDDIVCDGDKVAAIWTVRGTHQGPFMGLPATHKAIVMQEAGILYFKDGKLTEIKRVADDLSLLKQLGIIPS